MRLKPLAKKLADEYGATLKVIDIEATPDMVNAQNMRKAFTS